MNFTENLIKLLMGKRNRQHPAAFAFVQVYLLEAHAALLSTRKTSTSLRPNTDGWGMLTGASVYSVPLKKKKYLLSTLFIAWAKCSAVVLTSVSNHWAPQISSGVLARGMAPIHLFGGLSSCLTQVMLSTWRARPGVWTHKKTYALTQVAVRIRPYKKRVFIILVLPPPFWEEPRFIPPLSLWPTWLLCKRASLYKWVPLLLKLSHFLLNI